MIIKVKNEIIDLNKQIDDSIKSNNWIVILLRAKTFMIEWSMNMEVFKVKIN